ncbi:hypothetical protein RB600_006405 [Gaeumannomyces tritici]
MAPDRPSPQHVKHTATSGNRRKAEEQKAGPPREGKRHRLTEDGGDNLEARPRANKPDSIVVRREQSLLVIQQGSQYNGQITLSAGATLHQGNVTNHRTGEPPACLAALRTTDPRHDKARIEGDKGGLLDDVYQWVLSNDEFLQWRQDNQNRLLWIKRDPGKGKTMLLCGIINELEKKAAFCPIFSVKQPTRALTAL